MKEIICFLLGHKLIPNYFKGSEATTWDWLCERCDYVIKCKVPEREVEKVNIR